MKYLALGTMIIMGLFFGGCTSTTNGHVVSEKYQPKQTLSNWVEDQNGCKRWNPHPKPNETITWTGTCKNGTVDGFGTLQWYKDGTKTTGKTIGEFRNGKREGKATSYEDNGKSVGNFINDLLNGKGTTFYKNGTKETGNWRNYKRHGIFTFFREDGISYKIKYKRDRAQPYWIKDQSGCKHWNPNPQYGETVSWTGECLNGYGDGYGTLRWYKNSGYYHSENNVLQRRGKIDKKEKMSFPYFIKKGYHRNLKEKELKVFLDKKEPYVEILITNPKTKIKLFAIESQNDIACTKSSDTYTRRLGAMEQLMTLGTSSKATVTEYSHTCKFQNGYKNRMKNLIRELKPSNLASALKTLDGMEYWRTVSRSENWGVVDFIKRAASNPTITEKGWKLEVDNRNNQLTRKNVKIKCNDGTSSWVSYYPKKSKPYRTSFSQYSTLEDVARSVCKMY